MHLWAHGVFVFPVYNDRAGYNSGMTKVIFGERIGREGQLRLGCSAVILDALRQKVLLTRRADNGQWCLPSGGVEPGESVAEGCAREVWEETGLRVRMLRLVGVYSDPNQLIVYPDGNKIQIIALNFEAEVTGGELGLSDETTEFGYFSLEEAAKMDVISNHFQRLSDALLGETAALIK
jgi:ADP-ribose pyrophosphatase YjhB (NUDIX family)